MTHHPIETHAERLIAALKRGHHRLVTAESCTAGLIAATLAGIPGVSAVLECGFITYSNASKTTLLGVCDDLIQRDGAVSATVAAAMAEGALRHGDGTIAVSATGIAGPGGGSSAKPTGTVYIGVATHHRPTVVRHYAFGGDRDAVRRQSVIAALNMCADTA